MGANGFLHRYFGEKGDAERRITPRSKIITGVRLAGFKGISRGYAVAKCPM
jgi:hypothetical protein